MEKHIIDGIEMPFDSTWRDIAISLSGGADSTLLAYLLCSIVRESEIELFTVHIISHTRMWKTRPWQAWDSQYVYNWLLQEFPHINFKRHTNFIAPDIEHGSIGASIPDEYNKFVSGDNIQQRSYAEYICFQENISAYYNAVTHNPRGIDLGGMPERNIEPSEDNHHLTIMKHMDKWALHPFRFVEKDWIIKQYNRLGITNLLNKTRSCEGEFDKLNYQTYTPGQYVPVCGKCFWCKEREWAIEQNK